MLILTQNTQNITHYLTLEGRSLRLGEGAFRGGVSLSVKIVIRSWATVIDLTKFDKGIRHNSKTLHNLA